MIESWLTGSYEWHKGLVNWKIKMKLFVHSGIFLESYISGIKLYTAKEQYASTRRLCKPLHAAYLIADVKEKSLLYCIEREGFDRIILGF